MIDYAEVKRAVPMRDLLEREGIEVTRDGRALCPFHNDHKPSMKVYDDGFYCFSCNTGGDTISFYAKLHNVSNSEAAIALGGKEARTFSYAAALARSKKKKEKATLHELISHLTDLRREISNQGIDVELLDRQLDLMERRL